jgi:hypothetical protein
VTTSNLAHTPLFDKNPSTNTLCVIKPVSRNAIRIFFCAYIYITILRFINCVNWHICTNVTIKLLHTTPAAKIQELTLRRDFLFFFSLEKIRPDHLASVPLFFNASDEVALVTIQTLISISAAGTPRCCTRYKPR